MNYIIDFNPYTINNIDTNYILEIENKIINKTSITNKELSYFLNTIIYITRYNINPNLDNYDYKCDLAQSILYYYFKNLNCNIHPLTTQNSITNNITGHSFLTLELIVDNNKKLYLLDPTYIQFFKQEKCNKDAYFIHPTYKNYILLTPDPGYFIQEDMQQSAKFLLDYGYIELNEDTAKMYGDSFYNTKTGNTEIPIPYHSIPGFIYLNSFTKGSTQLSKTEEELINSNSSIQSFISSQTKQK